MTRNSPGDLTPPTGPRFDVYGSSGSTVITDARSAASVEMSSRIRRYTITMAFRTACFLSMVVVHGNFRWVLFGAAVFLPYVAVVLANQVNHRSLPHPGGSVEQIDAPQLSTGAHDVIEGQLADDDDLINRENGESHRRQDRVA
jgi:hypothetical protein